MTDIKLNKEQFIDKLIDYYYDHVFPFDTPAWVASKVPFEKTGIISGRFYSWLYETYGGQIDRETINFSDPQRAAFFLLKWA